MPNQPAMTPTSIDIERLITGAIFSPDVAIDRCTAYLQSETDERKRASAKFVLFRSHCERFRRARTNWLRSPTCDLPQDIDAERRSAEQYFREAIRVSPGLHIFPDDFEMQELVGVGEFAYVFSVTKKGMGTVGLKVLKQPFEIEQSSVDSFAQLAKMGPFKGSLQHIARVYQVNTTPPFPLYYTMDLINGLPLDVWLSRMNNGEESRQGTSLTDTLGHRMLMVQLLIQMAIGLISAHELGILHLDLKPSNILVREELDDELSRRYTIYLTDFGFLYLQLGGLPLRGISALSDVLEYLAPELQRDIAAANQRSDIYSFGKPALNVLTNQADNESTRIDVLAREEPKLAVLLVRCANRDQAERPASFEEIKDRLLKIKEDLENRQKQASEISELAGGADLRPTVLSWLLRIPVTIDPFNIVQTIGQAFKDSRSRRQVELKIGVAVPAILIGWIIRRLFVADARTYVSVNVDYLPCFLAALTCALIGFLYFLNITYRSQYYHSKIREAVRVTQSFQYAVPILIGIYWNQLWPFCTAAGYAVVALNNAMMWTYVEKYDDKLGKHLFELKRKEMANILKGYVGSGVIGVLGLVLGGLLLIWLRWRHVTGWGVYAFDLGLGGLVAVVNYILVHTSVIGEYGKRIWTALALEYEIRDQLRTHRRMSSTTKRAEDGGRRTHGSRAKRDATTIESDR